MPSRVSSSNSRGFLRKLIIIVESLKQVKLFKQVENLSIIPTAALGS